MQTHSLSLWHLLLWDNRSFLDDTNSTEDLDPVVTTETAGTAIAGAATSYGLLRPSVDRARNPCAEHLFASTTPEEVSN